MIKLLTPLGLLIIGWFVLIILARRKEAKIRSEWQALLSPACEKTFRQARSQIETNASMVEVAIDEAMEIRQLGDMDEALRFLSIGGEVIERFTPSLLSLLKLMVKFSRMMSAIAPVNPIVPHDFHMAELTSLAYLNQILHQILVSARQRFRLKLYILGKGVSIASRYLIERIKNVINRRSAVDQEWDEIVGIEKDFRRLSQESVQSFRGLLEALSQDAAKELARTLCLTQDPISHEIVLVSSAGDSMRRLA